MFDRILVYHFPIVGIPLPIAQVPESIRGSNLIRPDGKKPMEVQFALLVNDPEVQFLMMPMPIGPNHVQGRMMILEMEQGKARMKKARARKGKERGLNCPKDAVKPPKRGNRFATHTIVSSVRMPKMGSVVRGVSMFVGNASGRNHMLPVPMSDSTTVTHQASASSLLQVLLTAVLQKALGLILSCQI